MRILTAVLMMVLLAGCAQSPVTPSPSDTVDLVVEFTGIGQANISVNDFKSNVTLPYSYHLGIYDKNKYLEICTDNGQFDIQGYFNFSSPGCFRGEIK